MGTSAAYLAGSGMPGQQAMHLGLVVASVNGTGTAQSGATLLAGSNFYVLNTASGATAYVLEANKIIGTHIYVTTLVGTTALVYPELGAQIQGAGANSAFSVAQNKTALLVKVAALTWVAILTA